MRNMISRALRAILWLLSGLLLLSLLGALLITLEPVRNRILAGVIERIDRSQPGRFVAREAEWPSIEGIELRDLCWSYASDTLLTADSLSLRFDLGRLLRRDLQLRSVRVSGLGLDARAVSQLPGSPGGASSADEQPGQDASFGFLRGGSIEGLPSLAVGELHLSARAIQLSPAFELADVILNGSLDLLRDGHPNIAIHDLSVREATRGLSLDEMSLSVDLAEQHMSGQGEGTLGADLPFRLSIRATGPDAFELQFVLVAGRSPRPQSNHTLLTLQTRFEQQGARISAVSCTGLLETPSVGELSSYSLLAPFLAGWPEVAGIAAELEASFQLQPALGARASVKLRPNPWLEGGRLDLTYEQGDVWLDTLSVRLPDLDLGFRGQLVSGQLQADGRATARGMRWAAPLGSGESPKIDSLHARLLVHAEGTLKAPDLTCDLLASGAVNGARLDSVRVRVSIPGAADSAITTELSATGHGHQLSTRGQMMRGDTLQVLLAPLHIRRLAQTGDHNDGGGSTTAQMANGRAGPPGPLSKLSYHRASESMRIDRLPLTGDYGNLVVEAALEEARDLSFRVACSWREPPPGLRDLLKAEPQQWDSLQIAWRAEGPFRLDLSARAILPERSAPVSDREGLPATLPAGRLDATWTLPGPAAFRPWLPPSAEAWALGPLGGKAEAISDGSRLTIDLDLSETTWLEEANLFAVWQGRRLVIERGRVALEGLRVDASGSRADSLWDLRGRLDLTSPALFQRAGVWRDSTATLSLTADVNFRGTPARPGVDLTCEGRVGNESAEVPRFLASAHHDTSGSAIRLTVPEGLLAGGLQLDSLRIEYLNAGSPATWLPGHLSIAAFGRKLSWEQKIRLSRGTGLDLWTDSLQIVVAGQDLVSRQPFGIHITQDPPRIAIDGLRLDGSLGWAQADGWMTPHEAELVARARLRMPEKPPIVGIQPDLWPRGIELDLETETQEDLRANVRLEGLRLAGRKLQEVEIGFETRAEELRGQVAVKDSLGTILEMSAHFPGKVSLYRLSAELLDGSARGELRLHRFPVSLPASSGQDGPGPDRIAQVDGDLILRGTTAEPIAHAIGRLRLPGMPKVSDLALEFDLLQASTDEVSPEVTRRRASRPMSLPAPALPSEGGFAATFALVDMNATVQQITGRSQTTGGGVPRLIAGEALLPLRWSLPSRTFTLDAKEPLALRIEADDFDLDTLDPLLPANADLGGTVRALLTATGPLEDPTLEGELEATRVKLSLASGSNLLADARVEVAGTGRSPSVTGLIEVLRGRIIIPDPPKGMHPAEGEAVLWGDFASLPEPSPAAPEPVSVPRADEPAAAEVAATPEARRIRATADIDVLIPSGLWLRGRGLEVEMEGNLSVVQKDERPAIIGELRAVRGQYVFLGRVFQIETGRVTFYGGEEIDPSLDLILATRVEGATVRVLFTGTSQNPEIGFSSEPEMEEGDIIAFMLFGRPLDELDSDQMNLLQRRAADFAASYGTAQLEARLSRQLGVDMVTIRRGQSGNGASALVLGKYLSRRALLRYEQSLETTALFFVNLEYFLNRHLKIETMIGSRNQSGIEFNWTTEY